MARVIINGTIVKYPLGGMNLWFLSYLMGFKNLGHEVYFVEKSTWENSCFDVFKRIMTSDCSYGLSVLKDIMSKHGMEDRWCFADEKGNYYGRSKQQIEELFKSADIYISMEWEEWAEEAAGGPKRILIDGEPGWLQMKLTNLISSGGKVPEFDYYFTQGMNVGVNGSDIPLAGIKWLHTFSPTLPDDEIIAGISTDAAFTSVMNWQSNKTVEYNGKTYGQKDIEFEKFIDLPLKTREKLEVAVSGANVPRQRLSEHGWLVRNADDIAVSIDSYLQFIATSKGEFSVAKNAFIETQCGMIADRSAYYLRYGKPVVQQDTGFSKYLPCGVGLFAVRNEDEAASAIESISQNYEKHSKAGPEIAREYFNAEKVVTKILEKI